ncbi:MAG: hypothetical protein ACKO8I_03935 [Cyanobacteriota bacterium]
MTTRSFSLRTLLLGPLALQMLLMMLVIALVQFQGGRQELTRLATRSQERASLQVNDYLKRFLRTPQQVITLMAEAVANGQVDPSDRAATTRTLWMLRRTFPEAAYLNYGWTNGDFIGLGQVDNNSNRPFLEVAPASSIERLEVVRLDYAGRPAGLERIKPFADFRGDGWYHAPLEAGRAVWTPIYNWVDAPEVMAMGAGMPVRRQGVVVGVAEVDIFLANIGRYLRSLPLAETGVIYIVAADGRLVADSSGRLPFSIVNGHGVRHHAQESKDPLIRASARALLQRLGSFRDLNDPAQLTLAIPGSKALVSVDHFQEPGLDWHIVVVIPESEIYGALLQETARNALVTAAAILISGLLTLLVVQYVIRELDRLMLSTEALAEGNLTQLLARGSIREISRLATSMNEITIRLRRSFATLRQRNREIVRLAQQQRALLASREEQLQQEVTQRQRLEQNLLQAGASKPVPVLADPLTGLYSAVGLQRRLRQGLRQDSGAAASVLVVALALAADPEEPLDAAPLQRMAARLEQLAVERQGLAAYRGSGRFTLLLRGLEPDGLAELLTPLADSLAPLRIWRGYAWAAAPNGDGSGELVLLEQAELALELALARERAS